jgi:hypothetical protein
MRSIVTIAAMALGLGLVGIQTSSAAPVNGTVIQNAADLTLGTEPVGGGGYGYGYRRHYGGYGGYGGYGRGYGGYGYRRGY